MSDQALTATTAGQGELLAALRELAPLRIISRVGPSVLEAITELPRLTVVDGWLNLVTDHCHWHLRLDGLVRVRSRDEIHQRSGRQVLYFELADAELAEPYLAIYLHRGQGEAFAPARSARFAELHHRWGGGVDLRGGA